MEPTEWLPDASAIRDSTIIIINIIQHSAGLRAFLRIFPVGLIKNYKVKAVSWYHVSWRKYSAKDFRALPRWEIVFFSSLGISAYLQKYF